MRQILSCIRASIALLVVMSLWLVTGTPVLAQTGTVVPNTASISYDQGSTRLTFPTNEASFTIEGRRTSSTIEFFRFAPIAEEGLGAELIPTEFSPSGELSGPFVGVGDPITANGVMLDLSGGVFLSSAEQYLAGELIFVEVTDPGQNTAPGIIESLVVRLSTDNGDEVVLRLFETGMDTGVFCGYVQSSRDITPANDNVLSTPNNTQLRATYEDSFDATDISVDIASVEPFGRVFDGLTGELVNGALVTIINTETGQPAEVFGVDGVSIYPSTVESGGVAVDASGLEYAHEDGEYSFPLLLPGTYELRVAPPPNLVFPSMLPADAFQGLENGPFEIIGGSYGETFTVDVVGPNNFDIPLDGAGDLIVTKEAGTPTTAVGDFVGYTVRIENRNDVSSVMRVQDTLPRGFRYQAETARINGARIGEPEISADGRTLIFSAAPLRAGDTATLTYVALATAGAELGEAVNQAVATDRNGRAISNRAEAAVMVREDLLRSRLTIIGRVAEDACTPDQEWAREIQDGTGVEGVRVYLETGDYVVTDQDGLFHFEGVRPGTHVVQVDTETLPTGYEPVICEETSRYAGSAISKFVDATGGTIWRANFYLKRTEAALAASEDTAEVADAVQAASDFDQAWLDAQTADVAWVYPDTALTPDTLSLDFGVKHASSDTLSATLNGAPVPSLNYGGSLVSTEGEVAISRWRGLDIKEGRNVIIVTVQDQAGAIKTTLEETIWFVSTIQRAALVDDQSALVANGRDNPVISVRLTDSFGRPVHAGRRFDVDVAGPYALKSTERFEAEAAVSAALSNLTSVEVGANGIAQIELSPTLKTGLARLRVTLDTGEQQELEVFLRPEKRDWILVGLAEGSLGLERLDGPGTVNADELLNDGRLAFFAKGVIRGDWLLTLAVDTAKRRGDADGDIFDGTIDPNAFYTLYGDRTFQNREAESRFPLYVKLEKETFQVLFGDYDTDLNDTILGRYNRRLSGVRTVYEGERLSFSAFGAQTNQGFAREEIAADGTSGPFVLQNAPLLRNSETIIIETRNRTRPDEVVNQRNMTRYVDYEIDFDTGEIIFRTPVNATDAAFNPNVIIAEYETSDAVDRSLVVGGRVAARAFNDRVEVGATYIREEGDNQASDATSQLAGVDVTVQVDERTQVHAEYAVTKRDEVAEALDGPEEADALLLEVIRQQESFTATAYFREDEAGFGLGQQASSTLGARRFGARITAQIGRQSNDADEGGAAHFIDAEAYKEEALETGNTRSVVEAALRRESRLINGTVGLRSVQERFVGENGESEPRRSLLLTSSANKYIEALGLNLTAAHEQPLAGDDEATAFPQRTILGADKTLTSKATLNVRHEILKGANADGNNTVVGVTVQPFSGTTLTAATDLITQDSARRIGATVGVDQVLRINDKWSAGLGLARRANISDDTGEPLDVLPDNAISPLETAPASPLTQTEAFSSLYTGLAYRSENMVGSTRLEVRDSALGTRYTATFGAAREASDKLSYALASRYEQSQLDEANNTRSFNARLGVSYRPRGNGVVVYDRLDVSHDEVFSQSTNWKIVNNLGVNAQLTDRLQVAAFHGFKYSRSNFAGDTFDEVTNLVGGELRFDVTKKIDLGLSGSALISGNGQTDYQIGPSVGIAPADNVWMSLGWNVKGFRDNDFEAAEFSRDGPFIKLRVKFDQHTARGLLDRISPRGR